MSLMDELDDIVNKKRNIVKKHVINFAADLKANAAVGTQETTGIKGYRGGAFKAHWSVPDLKGYVWSFGNSMEYASVLWAGRRFFRGRWWGSEQIKGPIDWSKGGDVYLEQMNKDMQAELNRIT